jgi:hypothetical protein
MKITQKYYLSKASLKIWTRNGVFLTVCIKTHKKNFSPPTFDGGIKSTR